MVDPGYAVRSGVPGVPPNRPRSPIHHGKQSGAARAARAGPAIVVMPEMAGLRRLPDRRSKRRRARHCPRRHCPRGRAWGGQVPIGSCRYRLSRSSCWASFSTTSCCSCAFSAVCLASSEARPPSWRTPTSSTTSWLLAKMTMPSTRRSLCSGGDRAAPTFAPSAGLAARAASLSRSSRIHWWNFITAPCRGRFLNVVVGQGKTLALAEAAAVGEHGGRPQRQRHQRVPLLLGLGQVGEQPLTAVHDELEL